MLPRDLEVVGLTLALFVALTHLPGLLRLGLAHWRGVEVKGVTIGLFPVWRRDHWAVGALPFGTWVAVEPPPSRGAWFAAPAAYYLVAAGAITATLIEPGVPPEGYRVVVGDLAAGMPASRAGLRKDDQIVAVDGRLIRDFPEVAPAVDRGGRVVFVEVRREGQLLTMPLQPVLEGDHYRAGMQLWRGDALEAQPFEKAVWEGVKFPLRSVLGDRPPIDRGVRGALQLSAVAAVLLFWISFVVASLRLLRRP